MNDKPSETLTSNDLSSTGKSVPGGLELSPTEWADVCATVIALEAAEAKIKILETDLKECDDKYITAAENIAQCCEDNRVRAEAAERDLKDARELYRETEERLRRAEKAEARLLTVAEKVRSACAATIRTDAETNRVMWRERSAREDAAALVESVDLNTILKEIP